MRYEVWASEDKQVKGELIVSLSKIPTVYDLRSNRTPLTGQILMDWHFEKVWSYLTQQLTNVGNPGKVYYLQIDFREEHLVDFKRPPIYLTIFFYPNA